MKGGAVYHGNEPFAEISNRIFKTLKSLNADFTHTCFKVPTLLGDKIVANREKATTFGQKRLRTVGT